MFDDDNPAPDAGLNEYHAYQCAFCGEENEVFIDGGLAGDGSSSVGFTEDCEVCCRPNHITVFIDRYGSVYLEVSQEYEA